MFFYKYVCIKLLHKVHMVFVFDKCVKVYMVYIFFIFDKCVKIVYVISFLCNEFFILIHVIEEGLEFDGRPPLKILLKILRNRFKEWANNSLELIFMIKKNFQKVIIFY